MDDTQHSQKSPAATTPETLDLFERVFESAPIGIAVSGADSRFRTVNDTLAGIFGYEREEMVGMRWADLAHPKAKKDAGESSEREKEQSDNAGESDDDSTCGSEDDKTVDGEFKAEREPQQRFEHKSGRTIWGALTERKIEDNSTGDSLTITLIRDVSELRRTEELSKSLAEQTSRLAAIIHNSPLAVILTSGEGEMTYLNPAASTLLGVSQAFGALGHSIDLVDAGEDGKAPTLLQDLDENGRWSGERCLRSLPTDEVIPVRVTVFRLDEGDSCIGSLAVIAQDIRDRKLVERQLTNREKRLRNLAQKLIGAQEEERGRIARELHDDVTQRLAMLAVEIGILQSEPAKEPSQLSEKLEQMHAQVVELTDAVRNLSHEFHPSALSHSTLDAAVRSLCEEFEDRRGIKAQVRSSGEFDRVPRPTSTAVYRILQEGLRNIVRHAEAQQADITLECNADELNIVLIDDGKGFEPNAEVNRHGLGLTSMEERATTIGGTLEIHSEPGEGTRIEITIPIGESTGSSNGEDG